MITLSAALLSGCVQEKVNNPPVANFTWTPETPVINQTVKFTSTSTDPDGDELTFTWDFGDGSDLSSEENPTHIYTTNNTFTVTLTVNDGKTSNSTSKVINVGVQLSSNIPPIANFSFTTENLTVYFTDESVDEDNNITEWLWDFGDGNTSTEANPTYVYSAAGTYNVTLTVTDDHPTDPKTSTITKPVTVATDEENP